MFDQNSCLLQRKTKSVKLHESMWQCKEVFENDQRNGEAEIMEVPSSPHKVEALWHIQTCIIASGLIVNRLQVDLSRNSELNGKYN